MMNEEFKYLRDGRKVVLLAKTPPYGFIVQTLLDIGEDTTRENCADFYDGSEPHLVGEVFDFPPTNSYHAHVQALRDEIEGLEKQKAKIIAEVLSAKSTKIKALKEMVSSLKGAERWLEGAVAEVRIFMEKLK